MGRLKVLKREGLEGFHEGHKGTFVIEGAASIDVAYFGAFRITWGTFERPAEGRVMPLVKAFLIDWNHILMGDKEVVFGLG